MGISPSFLWERNLCGEADRRHLDLSGCLYSIWDIAFCQDFNTKKKGFLLDFVCVAAAFRVTVFV